MGLELAVAVWPLHTPLIRCVLLF